MQVMTDELAEAARVREADYKRHMRLLVEINEEEVLSGEPASESSISNTARDALQRFLALINGEMQYLRRTIERKDPARTATHSIYRNYMFTRAARAELEEYLSGSALALATVFGCAVEHKIEEYAYIERCRCWRLAISTHVHRDRPVLN